MKDNYIIKLLFIVTITELRSLIFAKELVYEPKCPKNWYTFRDSCYMITSVQTQWLSGHLNCENLNAEYLAIESDDEARFVQDTLYYIDSDVFFYVGAEDYMRRGYLRWFKSGVDVSSNLLCQKRTVRSSFEGVVTQPAFMVKRGGVYDVEEKCIHLVDANLKYHAVCERNCTNFDCLMLKNKTYDARIVLTPDQSCQVNQCQNNATCTPISRADRKKNRNRLTSGLKYTCHCLFGFTGELCQRDTRACWTPPMPRCRNNGTCVQSFYEPSDFECDCHYGFKGLLCEQNILCENVTCLNGGVCMDGICNCAAYYSGTTCEIKANDLVVLETFSKGVSVFAIGLVLFYAITLVILDALKYIFHVEPTGMDEQRYQMRIRYTIKKIGKERAALSRRVDRLTRIIKRLRDYRFHYMRWRAMRFIDDPTTTATASSSSATSLIQGAPSKKEISFYLSNFSIQKLA